jgi:uncharacterized membrane protein YidH (DUF202 family)
MSTLGISLIAVGIALVCAGLVFWHRAPQAHRADADEPHEFRAILDALGEEDRDENRD